MVWRSDVTTGIIGTLAASVVVAITNGEGPEVRRRPDEDHQEQQAPGSTSERVRDRGPTDQHGHRTGGAPDHDVLLAAALQPQRVDEHVEGRGRHREPGPRVGSPTAPGTTKADDLERDGEQRGRRAPT